MYDISETLHDTLIHSVPTGFQLQTREVELRLAQKPSPDKFLQKKN